VVQRLIELQLLDLILANTYNDFIYFPRYKLIGAENGLGKKKINDSRRFVKTKK
jgi:hypothetical protein